MIVEPARSKSRVLMTTDTVGGVFSYCVSLAKQLSDRGFELVIASMGPAASDDQRAQIAAIPNVTLCESQYALEWMDEPWADVDRAGRWLLELQRQFNADLVHLNGYSHAALEWPVPTLVVAHSCVLSWWRAVQGEPAPERYSEYARRVQRGLEQADCVVAPTRAFLESLRELYSFRTSCRVIANGADARAFRGGIKRPYFMAAGRLWDRAKNIGVIERVAPTLAWPVWVAGDSAPGESSRAPSQETSVNYLGRLSQAQLASVLGEASVFVHPARYEPFGLSALEAALAGCALVLGDLGTLREIWADAALYVAPDSEADLAAACRLLTHDDALRSELAERAARRARLFDLSRMGSAYAELYSDLLTRDARRTVAASSGWATQSADWPRGASTSWD